MFSRRRNADVTPLFVAMADAVLLVLLNFQRSTHHTLGSTGWSELRFFLQILAISEEMQGLLELLLGKGYVAKMCLLAF